MVVVLPVACGPAAKMLKPGSLTLKPNQSAWYARGWPTNTSRGLISSVDFAPISLGSHVQRRLVAGSSEGKGIQSVFQRAWANYFTPHAKAVAEHEVDNEAYSVGGFTSSSLIGLCVFGSIQRKGSSHLSVSSILTRWSHLGHLGPRVSKTVSGHLQLQSTVSKRSFRPSYLGILGGLHASQKASTSVISNLSKPTPNTPER